MTSLNELLKIGERAASNMSSGESDLLYQSELARTKLLYEQGVHTVYRNPDESMDDDERVIVICCYY